MAASAIPMVLQTWPSAIGVEHVGGCSVPPPTWCLDSNCVVPRKALIATAAHEVLGHPFAAGWPDSCLRRTQSAGNVLPAAAIVTYMAVLPGLARAPYSPRRVAEASGLPRRVGHVGREVGPHVLVGLGLLVPGVGQEALRTRVAPECIARLKKSVQILGGAPLSSAVEPFPGASHD